MNLIFWIIEKKYIFDSHSISFIVMVINVSSMHYKTLTTCSFDFVFLVEV